MRRTPPRLRPGFGALFLSLLALVVTAPPAAAEHVDEVITVQEITASPSQPSYLEPVTVTVSGVSACLVKTDGVDVGFAGGEPTFDLQVERSCLLDPPTPRPFSVGFAIPSGDGEGAFPRRSYRLRVVEEVGGGETLVVAEGPMLALHLAGRFHLETPDGPPTDDAPFTLRISTYGGTCLRLLGTSQPEPGLLQVDLDPHCPIGPVPDSLDTIDVEVGPLPAGDYTVRVVGNPLGDLSRRTVSNRGITVHRADGCVPSDTVLCLDDDRFRLTATWRDFAGGTGDGQAAPLPDRDDTGMFWFFAEKNVELTVKILDACGVNGHYWVFVSPGSTVEWELAVTDTEHDLTATYDNALGAVPSLIAANAAFPTCP